MVWARCGGAHPYPSTLEAETDLCEFEAKMTYRASSKTAIAIVRPYLTRRGGGFIYLRDSTG